MVIEDLLFAGGSRHTGPLVSCVLWVKSRLEEGEIPKNRTKDRCVTPVGRREPSERILLPFSIPTRPVSFGRVGAGGIENETEEESPRTHPAFVGPKLLVGDFSLCERMRERNLQRASGR